MKSLITYAVIIIGLVLCWTVLPLNNTPEGSLLKTEVAEQWNDLSHSHQHFLCLDYRHQDNDPDVLNEWMDSKTNSEAVTVAVLDILEEAC